MNQFFSGLIGCTTVALLVTAVLLGEGDNSIFHKSRVDSIKSQYVAMAHSQHEAMRTTQVLQDVARIEATNIVSVAASTVAPVAAPKLPQIKIETASVTGSSVNLREGPSTNHNRLGAVVNGDELILTGVKTGNWIEVQHPTNGGKAWMHGNYLEIN